MDGDDVELEFVESSVISSELIALMGDNVYVRPSNGKEIYVAKGEVMLDGVPMGSVYSITKKEGVYIYLQGEWKEVVEGLETRGNLRRDESRLYRR